MTSLTNVTLTLPSPPSSDNSNTGSIPNITTFVNGTSAGLTCFIHPDTNFVGWPYGGGGFNALPTTTSTSNGVESSSPAPSASASGDGSASDNGARGVLSFTPAIALLGALAGVLVIL
jgi:hypothetical protein